MLILYVETDYFHSTWGCSLWAFNCQCYDVDFSISLRIIDLSLKSGLNAPNFQIVRKPEGSSWVFVESPMQLNGQLIAYAHSVSPIFVQVSLNLNGNKFKPGNWNLGWSYFGLLALIICNVFTSGFKPVQFYKLLNFYPCPISQKSQISKFQNLRFRKLKIADF